jgi:hypothetical protein
MKKKTGFQPRRKAAYKKKGGKKSVPKGTRSTTRRPRTAIAKTIIGTSVGSTMSNYASPIKPMKLKAGLAALAVPSTFVVTNGYELQPFGGNQSQITVGQWFSLADIVNMSTQVAAAASTGPAKPPTMFHLHNLMAEVAIQNASNAQLTVDIYDVIAKQDLPASAASGPTFNVSTPINAWSQGLANQLYGSSLPPNCTSGTQVLGSKPMDSQLFQDYYRITSHKTVLMAQGGQHLHKVNLSVNKSMDLNKVNVAAQYLEGFKGLTQFTFLSVRGQPAYCDQDPPFTTTSPYLLRVISTERYLYSWLSNSAKTSTYNNGNMLTVTAPGNVRILAFNGGLAESEIIAVDNQANP